MYQSRTRLSARQIKELRESHDAGVSLRSLARRYGVSHETVRQSILTNPHSSESLDSGNSVILDGETGCRCLWLHDNHNPSPDPPAVE